jgi:hypothetical protein
MAVSTLYVISLLFAATIGTISYMLTTTKSPNINPLYGTTSSLILTYAFGASLLMYGMMVYFFSAFYTHAPRYILGFDVCLLVISLITLFLNPWQLQARLNGASGLDATQPAFLGLAISTAIIPLIIIGLLYVFRNPDRLLSLLLLINLLLIPFFFLTSGAINSFVLNDFTNNF